MDIPPETIILILAVIIIAAVAYLQLRYIRSQKQMKLDKALEQDDAYNAVATTKAVATSLRQAGRDTTEADLLIYQAETAYDKREFLNSIDLAARAKTALLNSKEKDLMTCPVPPPSAVKEVSHEVPALAAKKLPANYLESKFVIDTVRCLIPQASPEVKEDAQRSLDLAQTSYDGEDYNEALKHAMKAKRILDGGQKAEKVKPAGVVSVTPKNPAKPVPDTCRKCGSKFNEDDEFCHSCGTRKDIRTCPSCSREISAEDTFCRKCGAKI